MELSSKKVSVTSAFDEWVHVKVCLTRVIISSRNYHGYQNLSGQYLRTCTLLRMLQQVH